MDAKVRTSASEWIRWVILLPVAVIVGTFVRAIAQMGAVSTGLPYYFFTSVLPDGAMGLAYVMVGVEIAPLHKGVTGFVLASLTLLMDGLALGDVILRGEWLTILNAVALTTGAIIGAIKAYRTEAS